MIRVVVGNIFESQAQTLVNTVNCVGVMGKGLALEFKKRFPDMFEDYVARCKAKRVRLGEPYLYRSWLSAFRERMIIRKIFTMRYITMYK
jgi:O-acetyl-ADP-ribose deacetylase (regulator of RNase III)